MASSLSMAGREILPTGMLSNSSTPSFVATQTKVLTLILRSWDLLDLNGLEIFEFLHKNLKVAVSLSS